ncbi:MAG: isoleucine--tRNA ligase [Armatimonadetes bacterium]|nr:isoleucine--tRNA ligase [Armatimonadota bacterium]
MDLRSTLNLPDPDFTIPMKADLASREPEMQRAWDEMGLYKLIQDVRRGSPKYILHDGPPYTNSPVHIGTAFNKTLKDFVVRYKTIRGFHSPYVPGYDTHGLPIELAVVAKHGRMEPKDMRLACRRHAEEFIDIQTEQFKRFGVLGDWDHPYATMHYKFEAAIVRAFSKLAQKGYIYRDLRPTHWSIKSRTALADTELVYENHTSRAIYVRFPLKDDASNVFAPLAPLYTIIWTTTPWTIPGNLAVAFHPELEYSVFESRGEYFLLYDGLAEKVFEEIGRPIDRKMATLLGSELNGVVFKHPIFDRDSIAVMADYVTTGDGTGVVHTAPGHGHDDFHTGRKYGLPGLCPVDPAGVFTEEAGEFAGKSINDANAFIVERLDEEGHLLKAYDYQHSYPYGERDNSPVIYRTTQQWFLSIDNDDLRARALSEIGRTAWYPPQGETRIAAMVEGRPDWCISRQRIWGVGIPIVYGKESGEPVADPEIMERAAQAVEKGGSSTWFETDISEFIPEGFKHPKTGETEFRKETDVLDVWIDSGLTHYAVLDVKYDPAWGDLEWPADIYLEGSDQHRGWFNSSLTTATALEGAAPYRAVLTHGFVLDEKAEKMSKSKGNVVEPMKAANQYGADVLRYWAASVDYSNDVPCGDNLLKQMGENYRRVRNTLRFLLANLYDFGPSSGHGLAKSLDQWAVEQAQALEANACSEYDEFDFSGAISMVHNFCVKELSGFYLDVIKDRMYCDAKDSPDRRSGQVACYRILQILVRLVAPVLPHTAEEIYARMPMPDRKPTVFLETIEPVGAPLGEDHGVGALLEFRDTLNAQLEPWKADAGVKDTQDVMAKVAGQPELIATLEGFGIDLPTLLKLSWVELSEGSELQIEFSMSPYMKCERSRIRRPDVIEVNGIPLTERDRKVLGW